MLNFVMPRFSCSKLFSLYARMKLWSPSSKPDSKSERVISLFGKFFLKLGLVMLNFFDQGNNTSLEDNSFEKVY